MANEALVRASLRINKGNLQYDSKPVSFYATVTGVNGPRPGAITVPTTGVSISFTGLTTPALCRISNLDSANFVEYGIHDPETNRFYPLGEVLPGETYIIRLSRNIGEEYGTGTADSNNTLRFRANTASVVVRVEAFES